MSVSNIINTLHPIEIKILNAITDDQNFDIQFLLRTGLNEGQIRRGLDWLLSKGLIKESGRKTCKRFGRTEKGQEFKEKPVPAINIMDRLKGGRSATAAELMQELGMQYKNEDIGSTIGSMKKDGLLLEEEGAYYLDEKKDISYHNDFYETLKHLPEDSTEIFDESKLSLEQKNCLEKAKDYSLYKKCFKIHETDIVSYIMTEKGKQIKEILNKEKMTGDEISQLSPEMLKEKKWQNKKFRRYNLDLPAPHIIIGRKNPYREFLHFLKNKFIALGFSEMRGGLVETEFWNMDALFMPQTHPARDIHDNYFLKDPRLAKKIEEPYFTSVAQAHENGAKTGSKGWGYKFDRTKAKQLLLRSQGTVLSARMLASHPQIPGKYFAIARCFRYDRVDATHLADFFQVEGIVLSREVNFKTLLGLLTLFAREIARADDIKFSPAYFPFTEPSVELHIKHPKLGWYELGGAGIFRPELTIPLGVRVPVLAWGLGVDRMAMMAMGINDIRELFSRDLDFVRQSRMVM